MTSFSAILDAAAEVSTADRMGPSPAYRQLVAEAAAAGQEPPIETVERILHAAGRTALQLAEDVAIRRQRLQAVRDLDQAADVRRSGSELQRAKEGRFAERERQALGMDAAQLRRLAAEPLVSQAESREMATLGDRERRLTVRAQRVLGSTADPGIFTRQTAALNQRREHQVILEDETERIALNPTCRPVGELLSKQQGRIEAAENSLARFAASAASIRDLAELQRLKQALEKEQVAAAVLEGRRDTLATAAGHQAKAEQLIATIQLEILDPQNQRWAT